MISHYYSHHYTVIAIITTVTFHLPWIFLLPLIILLLLHLWLRLRLRFQILIPLLWLSLLLLFDLSPFTVPRQETRIITRFSGGESAHLFIQYSRARALSAANSCLWGYAFEFTGKQECARIVKHVYSRVDSIITTYTIRDSQACAHSCRCRVLLNPLLWIDFIDTRMHRHVPVKWSKVSHIDGARAGVMARKTRFNVSNVHLF